MHIKADSLLIVEQMKRELQGEAPGPAAALHARARLLAHEVGRVTFEHVRREFNQDADRLSNLGMDEADQQLKTSR